MGGTSLCTSVTSPRRSPFVQSEHTVENNGVLKQINMKIRHEHTTNVPQLRVEGILTNRFPCEQMFVAAGSSLIPVMPFIGFQ